MYETMVLKISNKNLDCPVQVLCGVTVILSLFLRGSSPRQGFQSWVFWMGGAYRDQVLLTQTCIRVFSGIF